MQEERETRIEYFHAHVNFAICHARIGLSRSMHQFRPKHPHKPEAARAAEDEADDLWEIERAPVADGDEADEQTDERGGHAQDIEDVDGGAREACC